MYIKVVLVEPLIINNLCFRTVRNSVARAKELISNDLRQKAPSSYSGLMCWHCKAENMEQCIEKGEIEICDAIQVC